MRFYNMIEPVDFVGVHDLSYFSANMTHESANSNKPADTGSCSINSSTLLSPLRGLIGVSRFPWVGTHGYGLSALSALGLLRYEWSQWGFVPFYKMIEKMDFVGVHDLSCFSAISNTLKCELVCPAWASSNHMKRNDREK